MPNKTQAKAAVDSAGTAIKADIDNILPIGVDITDGEIRFGPIGWELILNANNNRTTAESWATTIVTNLNTAGRPILAPVRRLRRNDDGTKDVSIFTALATYTIRNIG